MAMPKKPADPPMEMPGQHLPPKEAPPSKDKKVKTAPSTEGMSSPKGAPGESGTKTPTPKAAGTHDVTPPSRTPKDPYRQPVAETGWYHNPEFFEHRNTSFYDMELEIERGEQPSSKKEDNKGKEKDKKK
jgi:hypothetical protein